MSSPEKIKAFEFWKACIFSGFIVKIEVFEKVLIAMGYCTDKKRWIDFGIECVICNKRRTKRRPPKHERTAVRKARIGTARRRSIRKRQEAFDIKTGLKKPDN